MVKETEDQRIRRLRNHTVNSLLGGLALSRANVNAIVRNSSVKLTAEIIAATHHADQAIRKLDGLLKTTHYPHLYAYDANTKQVWRKPTPPKKEKPNAKTK